MSREPIRVRKGEVPKSEVIVDPDTPKHRRIRIALYVFACVPMILTILFGGEIGPPLLFLVVVIGAAHGCVRPGKNFRLVGGKRREQTAQQGCCTVSSKGAPSEEP
jgi:hypothetical protein